METVEMLKSELVVPAEATPSESIWLSNLDISMPRGYTSTVYFYRANGAPGFFAVDEVKNSLARALVAFYPLAGRLGLDGAGRAQVDCTGEGAIFVTARSGYVLDELLNDFTPCREMRDLFVPATPAPNPPCALLFVQVTYLRCGGVVLGLATHHSLIDARSAAHFVETWASIVRGSTSGDAASVPPCFDHRLLSARPTRVVLYDHPEYKPEPELEPPVQGVISATNATALITLSKEQVTALKARCPGASTFRAVAALVWQCVCRARALPDDAETRLYSVIDMRARLAPPLPRGYFGNAVVRTSVSATVGEVVSSPVAHVARRAAAVTSKGDDYARSLVDYLEVVDAKDVPPFGGISRADLRANSWMGMSLHDSDFGWGAPVFMGPALMNLNGFVYVMQDPGNDGAVVLALSLEPESMPEFRKVFADELALLEQ